MKQIVCKVYQKDNINIHRNFETPGNFGYPKGAEKMNFCPKRATTLKSSDIKH